MIALFVSLALAVSQDASGPPGVALVLSGGGARTVAAVGVLEELERLHVPVDFVVGCEGGALIGGLYAAGRTPAEVARLVAGDDWIDAIEGREARRTLSWRRRVESRDFLFEVPVTLREGSVALPKGLLRTRRLNLLVDSESLVALGESEFDRFPTPFRAVATDLATGEAVVLERELASALLASHATPLLLPPIELEGRSLTSGVLSNPLPASVALARGARVVIVVDCTADAGGRKPVEDALDVASALLVLEGSRRRREELAALRPGDVRLEPQLGKLSPFDHREPEKVLEAGRAAVRAAQARLEPLALDPEAWSKHVAAREARRMKLPSIARVRFEERGVISERVLEAQVESGAEAALSRDTLAKDLERLYGLDLHQRIAVKAQSAPQTEASEAEDELVFHTEPAPWAPVQLRTGGVIEGDLRGDAAFALGIALNWRPFNAWGGEWRNRVEFGSRFTLASEYYQPLDARQLWFFALMVGWNQRRTNITSGNDALAEYEVAWLEGGLDLGRVLSDWGELRVGARGADARANLKTGDPANFGPAAFQQGGVRTLLTIDTFDSTGFPREGHFLRTEWNEPVDELGGNDEATLRVDWNSAWSFGATTVAPGALFGTALDNGGTVSNLFPLGGFLRLSGYQRDELSGRHAALARVVVWRELGRRAHSDELVSYHLGCSLEAGNVFVDRDDIRADAALLSGSAFLGFSTVFGPAYVGVGSSEGGRVTAFVAVGGQF